MDFELLGVCLDRKMFRRGCDRAPLEIRRIFPELETFVNGIDLQEHWIKDLGNIEPQNYDKIILEMKRRLDGKFPIIFGGDHSITYAGVKAVNPKIFVSFDAHPDCENSDICFRSVTRKIVEEGYKTYLYGVRCLSKEETRFLKNNKMIKIATLDDLKKINEPIYLSIDFDVLDPSLMPSVGVPEPNGLSFSQVLDAVKALAKNLIAVDFVEFLPENSVTSLIAGKLVYATLAEIARSKSLH
jgi:agmatinase